MNRFLHTLYCDDIRHEIGNKVSLIGVYGADLFVSDFPAILPRLALLITVCTDADAPIRKLTIRVLKDEEELLVIEQDEKQLATLESLPGRAQEKSASNATRKVHISRAIVNLAPFIIERPGVLRVVAQADDEELRCPVLKLDQEKRKRPSELATRPDVAAPDRP